MKPSESTFIVSLGLLLFSACAAKEPAPAVRSAFADARLPSEEPAAGGPPFGFADVTAAAGVAFRHDNGASGLKFLPETMGSGVAVLDAEGDGFPDLFFVNSGPLARGPAAASPCAYYRNRGDGTFVDASAETGLGISLFGMGAVAADYDGDGDQDLYVTAVDRNRLLRNDEGKFTDVTEEAGVGGGRWREPGGVDREEWSSGAAFFDADRDGDLDLLVANYVRWSPGTDVFATMDGRTKAYTTPTVYPGLPPRLYLNRGDGTFADESARLRMVPGADPKALGVLVTDADLDGHPDVFVSNDTQPNQLFLNSGDGTFSDQALECGVAFDETGRARAGMGVGEAVLPGGELALAVGNFSREPVSLFTRFPAGLFVDRAAPSGLGAATLPTLTFGLVFADFDLDGRQDLLLSNGHIEPTIGEVQREVAYAEPPQLFLGGDKGRFRDVSKLLGADFAVPRVGRGAATGDFDRDGDVDLVLTQNGRPAVLLLNDGAERGSWLRVRLRSPGPNREGIGATVTLRAGEIAASVTVRTGGSYLSQGELAPTFGLGGRERVDLLEVRWPDGTVEEHRDLPARREVVVTRGGGIMVVPD